MNWWNSLFSWLCWWGNNDRTIVDIIKSNGNFSTLAQVIEYAGGADALNGLWIGQMTLFAPTNEAFDDLDESIKQRYLEDDQWNAHLNSLLRYHALRGSLLSDVFEDGMDLETLDGSNITVHLEPELKILDFADDEAFVVDPFDEKAQNGVVHAVDKVLLPPSAVQSIEDFFAANLDSFSELQDILDTAGVSGKLAGDEGPYTVFAPTNDAFERFFDQLSPESILSLSDGNTLQKILNYHVVEGIVTATDMITDIITSVENEIELETVHGGAVKVAPGHFLDLYVEDSKIVDDVLAKNGVIHVIDGVLIPPGFADLEVNEESAVLGEPEDEQEAQQLDTIAEVAADLAQERDLSTLVRSLEAANLVDVLDGKEVFTVFAPNDAAFDNLQDGILDSLLSDTDELRKVLLNHVVNGKVLSSDLKGAGELVSMLEGNNITVEATNSSFILNGDAQVLFPDILATNGVIHVIDNVLMPPSDEFPDIAEKSLP